MRCSDKFFKLPVFDTPTNDHPAVWLKYGKPKDPVTLPWAPTDRDSALLIHIKPDGTMERIPDDVQVTYTYRSTRRVKVLYIDGVKQPGAYMGVMYSSSNCGAQLTDATHNYRLDPDSNCILSNSYTGRYDR